MIGIVWISYGPPPPTAIYIFCVFFWWQLCTSHQNKKMVSKIPSPNYPKKTRGFYQTFFCVSFVYAMSPTSSLGVATVRWNHAALLSRSQQRSRRHGDAEWRAGGLPPGKDFFRPKKIQRFFLYGCFLKWWYPQNTPKWSFLVGKPHGCWVPPF